MSTLDTNFKNKRTSNRPHYRETKTRKNQFEDLNFWLFLNRIKVAQCSIICQQKSSIVKYVLNFTNELAFKLY